MEQKMMNAALIREIPGDAVLGEIAAPMRKAGQVLIEVRAASLNPLDLLVASGKFYLGHPPVPYVPGLEGAGAVLEGSHLQPGTRVRFECGVLSPYGSLAPLAVVDENAVIPVPENAPDDLVASLGIAGMAGWLSVEWRARLSKGERVAVLGATGVVGQIAVQAARLLGAGRIVAVGRNPRTLRKIQDLGADASVELDQGSDSKLGEALKEAAGGPIDVVIDTLWGNPVSGAIMAMASGGRLVNIGQSADPVLSLPSSALRGKMLSLLGYSNLLVPLEEQHNGFHTILEHAVKGNLKVNRQVSPLTQASQVWRSQRNSPNQKLVVIPS